ncbi:MAG TPA: carboxypeptidase regulatory-like domain-containing protein [Planctomicrobium sp.]|nr:carboxypeptidase regulatory-like domain-containing protein [Planctomicrobium sp.]
MFRSGMFLSLLVTWFALSLPQLAVCEEPAKPFEWNVFLNGWQVLGPLPKTDTTGGIHTSYGFADEDLRPGSPHKFQGKSYAWQNWEPSVVEWNEAFGLPSNESRNLVAYAWTSFTSPTAQQAILSIGADDSIGIWLNGKEVKLDDDTYGPCRLDQFEFPVQLLKGENTLLLKCGQRYGEWEAIARLLPPEKNRTPLTILCNEPDGRALYRMPDLSLEFLNAQGEIVSTAKTSGHRGKAKELVYRFVPPELKETPDRVRIHYSSPGFHDNSQTVSWNELTSSKVTVSFAAQEELEIRIVDAKTFAPIPFAHVWKSLNQPPLRADEEGTLALPKESPLLLNRWISAPGYEATQASFAWPRVGIQNIPLKQGGKILTGIVRSSDGKPISGARIEFGSSGFNPRIRTDDNGTFEVSSLSRSTENLYPVITAPGYIAKDRFQLFLSADGITAVEWVLEPGATVNGRVTAASDGRPLSGITVTCGHDRFGSNHSSPSAKTDKEGRYRLTGLPSGQQFLHAFSENFAPAMTTFTPSLGMTGEQNFVLEEGQAATGRIVDESGTPIEKVWVITDTWNGARMFRRETYTDADGRFTLNHMPNTPAKTNALKQGFVSNRDLQIKGGDQIELILPRVVKHTVKIRLEGNDAPVPDLMIQKGYKWTGRNEVHWNSETWETERAYQKASGEFVIALGEPNNSATISYRFRYPGHEDATVEVPVNEKESKTFDVILKKSATLRGRVVSAETGEPLAGITVALPTASDRLYRGYVEFHHPFQNLKDFTGIRGVSGKNGEFELSRPDPSTQAELVLMKETEGFFWYPGLKDWGSKEELIIPYPEAGVIEGQVLVAGKPVAETPVHLQWLRPDRDDPYRAPFGLSGQKKTDANGYYRFTGLGPGKYHLQEVRSFNSPGQGGMSMYLSSPNKGVVVESGQTMKHDLVTPEGHSLTVRTVDRKGNPVPNCIISVMPGATHLHDRLDARQTDSAGVYTFRHLPARSLRFQAEHYAAVATETCGLGERDLSGVASVTLPTQSELIIKLDTVSSQRGGIASPSLKGQLAPALSGKLLEEGGAFNLNDHWGKVVVIDFWATWCGPCMAVMPQIKEFQEKFKDNDDVVFITISLDQEIEALKRTMKDKELDFPVIFSGEGWQDGIAQLWGVQGIPATFIVGRDGRFASEKIHANALSTEVEKTLKIPFDPNAPRPSLLAFKFTLDGEPSPIPGMTLTIDVTDSNGKQISTEEIRPMPSVNSATWAFTPKAKDSTSDHTVTVTAHLDGSPVVVKTLKNPQGGESLEFPFRAPRTIHGKVTLKGNKEPLAGLKVNINNSTGKRRLTTTDSDGNFRMGVLPGSYFITVEGTDEAANLPQQFSQLAVTADRDPEELSIELVPAITLKGIVVNAEGIAQAHADIMTTSRQRKIQTDNEGKFELRGVPSEGSTMIYAIKNQVIGGLTYQADAPPEELKITLGQGMENQGGASSGMVVGMKLPELELNHLDGTAATWSAVGDEDQFLVFCMLSHPDGLTFFNEAQQWSQKNQVKMTTVSLDPSPLLAQRLLKEMNSSAEVFFAGPQGAALGEKWKLTLPAQGVLVSPKGIIKAVPQAGSLP